MKRFRSGLCRFALIAVMVAPFAAGAFAQSDKRAESLDWDVGDLPGVGMPEDTRRPVIEQRVENLDTRGTVQSWTRRSDHVVIGREAWTDQRGHARGRFGVGIPF